MVIKQKPKFEDRIGIFGGAFNPFHIGHMKMAEAARKEYKLSVVYFIPCGVPPHKRKEKLLPAKLRYKLVKEAIKGKKHFKVLDIEIKKREPAYTFETAKELNSHLPTLTSHLYFLIGADEFKNLRKWKRVDLLAKMVTFLVLPRPNKIVRVPNIKNLNWSPVKTKPINISSSDIRKKMKRKESLKGLVPTGILKLLSNKFPLY